MFKCIGIMAFLIIGLLGAIHGQETFVTGKVVDKGTNQPIANSTLSLFNKRKGIYKTISDSAGVFRIPLSYYLKAYSLKIHNFNNLDIQINFIPNIDSLSKAKFLLGTYQLSPVVIELKEVVIKLKKRYSDTSRIDLSKKSFEHSVMIDDLFSSNLGFSKNANGQLYYKGKPVSTVSVNGDDFFEQNNLDIYHLLPALILDHIDVIETNIDDVTNTTLLSPTLKVDLKFKGKYKKGKFGSFNIGVGTEQRYMANTNLFLYKNREQVSLSLNSNNVNGDDNPLLDPGVKFSANSNNTTTSGSKFTYKNVFSSKVEINFSVKGVFDKKNFTSESTLQEQVLNLFAKTYTSSGVKSFKLNDEKFDIGYKIDSLNTINAIQSFNHTQTKEINSSNYNIKSDSLSTVSQLNNSKNSNINLFDTKLNYQKRFGFKKGSLFKINVDFKKGYYKITELDNVYNLSGLALNKYFIDGDRSVNRNNYSVYSDFTQPLDNDSFINFFIKYEKDKLNYNTLVKTDTTINNLDLPSSVVNRYFKSGLKFQKTMSKISVDADVITILDLKTVEQVSYIKNQQHFLNFNWDIKADYKINKEKSLSWNYSDVTYYPDIQQLTSLFNSFNLVSQNSGNILLKPEEKEIIKVTYNTIPSESENINFSGEFDHFNSKFGLSVINSGNSIKNIQTIVTDNVGSSSSGQISFSVTKNIAHNKYFTYNAAISYQEDPNFINNKLMLNNGVTFNQSLSTSIAIIKPFLVITPLFAYSYGKFFYETNSINVTTFTYSDNFSVKLKTLKFNLYPLFNYNHNINNNASFSINGEIKKSIFKDYGSVWVQAYDIFNSFKFYNNNVGSYYNQSVIYSNLQRYFLLGISLRFNNIR